MSSDTVQRYEISAAIDFGTTYCGLAYSHHHDKKSIIAVTEWPGGGTLSSKVPTAVLFDSNKKFVAFGQEAVKKYIELTDDGQDDDYFYFHRFKMILYKEKVNSFSNMIPFLFVKMR